MEEARSKPEEYSKREVTDNNKLEKYEKQAEFGRSKKAN